MRVADNDSGIFVTELNGTAVAVEVRGGGGDDTLTLSADGEAITTPVTFDGGAGFDTATVLGSDLTVDLATLTVAEASFGAADAPGVERLRLDGLGTGAVTLNGTDFDDTVEVTPATVRIRKVELSASERSRLRGRRAKSAE